MFRDVRPVREKDLGAGRNESVGVCDGTSERIKHKQTQEEDILTLVLAPMQVPSSGRWSVTEILIGVQKSTSHLLPAGNAGRAELWSLTTLHIAR